MRENAVADEVCRLMKERRPVMQRKPLRDSMGRGEATTVTYYVMQRLTVRLTVQKILCEKFFAPIQK